jgi:hypothetical protein
MLHKTKVGRRWWVVIFTQPLGLTSTVNHSDIHWNTIEAIHSGGWPTWWEVLAEKAETNPADGRRKMAHFDCLTQGFESNHEMANAAERKLTEK